MLREEQETDRLRDVGVHRGRRVLVPGVPALPLLLLLLTLVRAPPRHQVLSVPVTTPEGADRRETPTGESLRP